MNFGVRLRVGQKMTKTRRRWGGQGEKDALLYFFMFLYSVILSFLHSSSSFFFLLSPRIAEHRADLAMGVRRGLPVLLFPVRNRCGTSPGVGLEWERARRRCRRCGGERGSGPPPECRGSRRRLGPAWREARCSLRRRGTAYRECGRRSPTAHPGVDDE